MRASCRPRWRIGGAVSELLRVARSGRDLCKLDVAVRVAASCLYKVCEKTVTSSIDYKSMQ